MLDPSGRAAGSRSREKVGGLARLGGMNSTSSRADHRLSLRQDLDISRTDMYVPDLYRVQCMIYG